MQRKLNFPIQPTSALCKEVLAHGIDTFDQLAEYVRLLPYGRTVNTADPLDTACGYAAATMLGQNLLASHFSVNCLRPAVGERFTARARVVKPGRSQVFTACELFASAKGKETLVATGETLLTVVSSGAKA
jgi:hypothetical protein